MPRAWIGCSGWVYDHWVGVLYPPGLPKARWRQAYTDTFDTVELNASFYRWPGTKRFQDWGRVLPDGFRMAPKASQWISHRRRLVDPDGAWARRLTEAWEGLGAHAGPVLVQLPAAHERDVDRLTAFLDGVPRRVPLAFELRHPSWHDEAVYAALEAHGAAYVVMSGAGLRCELRATTSFVYVRLHGPSPEHLYDQPYSEDDLQWWAARTREWLAQGRDVWVYFNNDGHGWAVRNAQRLREILGAAARDEPGDGTGHPA